MSAAARAGPTPTGGGGAAVVEAMARFEEQLASLQE
jgi:hypothetical protein